MTTTMVPVLRRSALEAASQCLFRYKALWVDGVDDTTDYALRGIGFHAAAQRYIARLLEARVPSDAEEARAAFPEGLASVPVPGRLEPEIRSLYDRWAEHFALDLEAYVTAEERQETGFTPDLVYARPDGLEIVDWKTYYVALSETQARAEWQPRYYIRRAMQQWPHFKTYRFTYAFVRLGSFLTLTFTPEELDTLERDVEAVLARLQAAAAADEWPATPGPSCSFCELACPIASQPQALPKRLTPDQAPQLAAWILAAETVLRGGKKLLKQYCGVNGAVAVQGVEFDHRPIQTRAYPIDAVLEILKERSLFGAFADLTVSASALAKVFKAYPEVEEALSAFVQEKTVYRFGAKKPGSGDEEDA